MQAEAVALLSKMWKAISAKRTGWGWFFALISAIFFLSDRWDSLNSFYEKLKKMGAFFKFVVDTAHSPFVQLSVFAAGVIWIGLAAFFSAKAPGKKNNGLKEPKEPQPILAALDELHVLFYEGQTMEGRFEIPEATKPTFQEVEAWNKKAIDCAKQQSFKDVIMLQDIARFTKKWDDAACRKAQKTLEEHGVLDGVDDVGRTVYRHLFGRVRRLGELIAKIEDESTGEVNVTSDASKKLRIVTAELLPDRGAPVLVKIVNKSERSARIHSARLFGVSANGDESELPNRVIASERQGWGNIPFVMEPGSRITIAFAGMCLAMLPREFIAYLAEIELEDETKIRTDRRISFSNAIALDTTLLPEQPRRTITDDQAGKIIDKLKGLKLRPVQITTRYGASEDDPEAYEYAMQVKSVLREAGVTVNSAAIARGTLFPTGVSIFVKDQPYNEDTAAAIIDAIRLTGVECKPRQRQVWYGNGIEPEINLIIGANEITPPANDHRQIETAELQALPNRPKQREIIQSQETIGELIEGGDELLRRMMQGVGIEAQFNQWSEICEEFLRISLDTIAVKLFRSPAIISYNPIGGSLLLSEPWHYQRELYERISSRVTRLREIMKKIETGEFEPC